MRSFLIKRPYPHIWGKVVFPGDKSIAHRALIISALATGSTKIRNFPLNDDNLATLRALKQLGIVFNSLGKNCVIVQGKGLFSLRQPRSPIFINESGTTIRLLSGVLAGQNFPTKLTAGHSLSKRPMRRVIEPLRLMGARISARSIKKDEFAPIIIHGGNLKGITYHLPVASAQVKSAILLAGLYAKGRTVVIEKTKTRDHTERMLKVFKARISVKGNSVFLDVTNNLISPKNIYIPGDISSAAFFMVLAALLPESNLVLENVGINPSRLGIVKVLKRMGAKIKTQNAKRKTQNWEPIADLIVKSSSLKGTIVTKREVPSLIDELPILMVAASLAKGRTVFKGAGELRVKETDRIHSMCENLRKMGAKIKVRRSGSSEDIIIEGVKELKGASVKSFGDHRTAMSMVVAGLAAKVRTRIDNISCINKSFPDFIKIIKKFL